MRSELKHIPGLDGVRALAALLVVSTHWPGYLLSVKFGWMGVSIFFVLSGFLITRILVSRKDHSLKNYLSEFYIRRTLRIFPVYYAYLLVTFVIVVGATYFYPSLLNITDWKMTALSVKHDFIWLLTYTYNLRINASYFFPLIYNQTHFYGHLWSLSFEEQFYLLFPLLVYFSSIKTLKKIAIGMLILCPLLRLFAALYGIHHVSDRYWLGELFYSNTFLQSDSLFTGAAIALFDFKIVKPYLTFFAMLIIWLGVGLIIFAAMRKAGYFWVSAKTLGYDFPGYWFMYDTPSFFVNIRGAYLYTLVNFLAAVIILPAVNGKSLFPAFFENRHLMYFGKISYGVYIFHNPILMVFIMIGNRYLGGWNNLIKNPFLQIAVFAVYFSLVVALAHCSFKYFEKKVLKYRLRLLPLTANA